MKTRIGLILCLACWLTVCDSVWGENWMRFRGPTGQGISSETKLPVTWSATKNIKWKASLPGNGWSSPIVFEDYVFLTAASEEGASCRVICVNRKDGSIVWNTEVHRQKPGPMRKQNSYATPTPVTDGKHIYAPVGSHLGASLVCLEKRTGKVVWKTGKDYAAYTGLMLGELAGVKQIVMLAADRVIGYAAKDGRELWSAPATTGAARFQNGCASIGHHLSPIHWNAIEPNQPERFTARITPSKVTSALIPPLK